eukprot:gene3959-biopygen13420
MISANLHKLELRLARQRAAHGAQRVQGVRDAERRVLHRLRRLEKHGQRQLAQLRPAQGHVAEHPSAARRGGGRGRGGGGGGGGGGGWRESGPIGALVGVAGAEPVLPVEWRRGGGRRQTEQVERRARLGGRGLAPRCPELEPLQQRKLQVGRGGEQHLVGRAVLPRLAVPPRGLEKEEGGLAAVAKLGGERGGGEADAQLLRRAERELAGRRGVVAPLQQPRLRLGQPAAPGRGRRRQLTVDAHNVARRVRGAQPVAPRLLHHQPAVAKSDLRRHSDHNRGCDRPGCDGADRKF